MGRGAADVVKVVERVLEHLKDVFMGIALRQQPGQRGEMGHAEDGMRGSQQRRRAQPRAFELVVAEMLVEPRPPHRGDAVAGLQHRAHALAGAAAHEAEMAAMLAGQQFDDGGGFAMPPHAQDDAVVGPFHGVEITGFRVVGRA